jgi:hypothetical protein
MDVGIVEDKIGMLITDQCSYNQGLDGKEPLQMRDVHGDAQHAFVGTSGTRRGVDGRGAEQPEILRQGELIKSIEKAMQR